MEQMSTSGDMPPNARAIAFFHEHLGRHLAPDATPEKSVAPSLPTRTKHSCAARKKDPDAELDVRRVGTSMPVFYIVTEDRSLFLSNTEPPSAPGVESVRIDPEDGKATISGQQYIAHWLYHEAPRDRPFLIGNIEKANPAPSVMLSYPPHRVRFCTTSGRIGELSIHLDDYRADIASVKESGIPWRDVKKTLRMRHEMRVLARSDADDYQATNREAKLRKQIKRVQKKHPDILRLLSRLNVMPGSPDETMLGWFFADDNDYGRRQ